MHCRAAEQLVGIELDPVKFTPSNTRFQRGSSSVRRRYRTNEITSTPIAGVSYVNTPIMEEDDSVNGDFYLLAKSYFDCREYRRAAHALQDQTSKKSVFLRCYALYLVCWLSAFWCSCFYSFALTVFIVSFSCVCMFFSFRPSTATEFKIYSFLGVCYYHLHWHSSGLMTKSLLNLWGSEDFSCVQV